MARQNSHGRLDSIPVPVPDGDAVFVLTKADVVCMCEQMDLSPKVLTDEVMYQVKQGVMWGLSESWPQVLQEAITYALKS